MKAFRNILNLCSNALESKEESGKRGWHVPGYSEDTAPGSACSKRHTRGTRSQFTLHSTPSPSTPVIFLHGLPYGGQAPEFGDKCKLSPSPSLGSGSLGSIVSALVRGWLHSTALSSPPCQKEGVDGLVKSCKLRG